MPERIVEVRVFELRYDCDAEGCDGRFIPAGEPPISINPLRIKHRCGKCREVKYLPGQYPTVMSIPVNDPIPKEWEGKLDDGQVRGLEPKSKIQLS